MIFVNNEGLIANAIEYKDFIVREILAAHDRDDRGYSEIGTMPAHSTIEEFVDAVKSLLDILYKDKDVKIMLKDIDTSGHIMENPHVPGQELSGIVTYEMLRRAPGTMKGGNDWFSESRREVKPRVRMVTPASTANPYATAYSSQWFDNLVCFKIYAKTAYRANKLALEFEDIMESYRFFFVLKGITKYFFKERTQDFIQQAGGENYYCRPLEYYVRTETTYTVSENAINRVLMNIVS
jgi:hypothetical protein